MRFSIGDCKVMTAAFVGVFVIDWLKTRAQASVGDLREGQYVRWAV